METGHPSTRAVSSGSGTGLENDVNVIGQSATWFLKLLTFMKYLSLSCFSVRDVYAQRGIGCRAYMSVRLSVRHMRVRCVKATYRAHQQAINTIFLPMILVYGHQITEHIISVSYTHLTLPTIYSV